MPITRFELASCPMVNASGSSRSTAPAAYAFAGDSFGDAVIAPNATDANVALATHSSMM